METNNKNHLNNPVVIIILLALVGVGGYFLFNKNQNQESTTPSSYSTNSNQPQQKTDTPSANDMGVTLRTPADWANAPIPNNTSGHWKKISLGADPVTEDSITFSDTITDLGQFIPSSNIFGEWGFGYPKGRSTTGDFVQVDLTMNNTTQYPALVEVVLYYLADQAGRGYQFVQTNSPNECSGGGGVLSVPQTLKPGIPCVAHILYEVSKDSKSFNLDFDARNDQYNDNKPYGK
jgi:hypothetical protein